MTVELSLAALDLLWADLRLGPMPFPLEIPSHGDTHEVRDRIRAAVYADLGSRGLAVGHRADDRLVEKLRLLAAPTHGIDLVALLDLADQEPLRAVAVTRGRHGLLAVQRPLTVCLHGMRATTLVAALVGLLPPTPAAAGRSITRPVAAFVPERPAGVLRAVTPPTTDPTSRALAAIAARPVRRAGQFGLTSVDGSGRRHRLPGLGWFDTDDGRYATTMAPGPDGADWVTIWPADNARLTHRIAETIG